MAEIPWRDIGPLESKFGGEEAVRLFAKRIPHSNVTEDEYFEVHVFRPGKGTKEYYHLIGEDGMINDVASAEAMDFAKMSKWADSSLGLYHNGEIVPYDHKRKSFGQMMYSWQFDGQSSGGLLCWSVSRVVVISLNQGLVVVVNEKGQTYRTTTDALFDSEVDAMKDLRQKLNEIAEQVDLEIGAQREVEDV